MAVRIQRAASYRIDDIYRHTRERWGVDQAERYVSGLLKAIGEIETTAVQSRPISADFGVRGNVFRYQRHLVYWRYFKNGDVGIVTILHERMHRIDRFREDSGH
jgi:plasmid stabilization system protein ParE